MHIEDGPRARLLGRAAPKRFNSADRPTNALSRAEFSRSARLPDTRSVAIP
ncbi:hypothetical protein AB0I98_01780 [Streptomyces sp. NPDC050211]|uniref:hypothetical protein n=1 Tax=Streptomyces sp. NPDC050211 TaxID=3154932 RepID=UPI003447DDE1